MIYPDIPSSGSKYLQLKQGKNRIRILAEPIHGIEWWEDNKPIRVSWEDRDKANGKPKSAYFWALPVWDYDEGTVKVFVMRQKSIMRPIKSLADDEEWGDSKGYDITITKTGESMQDTEYTVMPNRPKELDKEILEEWEKIEPKLDLEALYEGGDPFAKVTGTTAKPAKTDKSSDDDVEIDISDIPF